MSRERFAELVAAAPSSSTPRYASTLRHSWAAIDSLAEASTCCSRSRCRARQVRAAADARLVFLLPPSLGAWRSGCAARRDRRRRCRRASSWPGASSPPSGWFDYVLVNDEVRCVVARG
jgi:hypothetical protein